MNTAQISDEHAVYKDPDIVIAGKLICHLILFVYVGMPTILLYKAGLHMEPKIMVDPCMI